MNDQIATTVRATTRVAPTRTPDESILDYAQVSSGGEIGKGSDAPEHIGWSGGGSDLFRAFPETLATTQSELVERLRTTAYLGLRGRPRTAPSRGLLTLGYTDNNSLLMAAYLTARSQSSNTVPLTAECDVRVSCAHSIAHLSRLALRPSRLSRISGSLSAGAARGRWMVGITSGCEDPRAFQSGDLIQARRFEPCWVASGGDRTVVHGEAGVVVDASGCSLR